MELSYILLFLLILFILKCNCNRTEGMDNGFWDRLEDNLIEMFDCKSARNTHKMHVRPFYCMF